MRAPADANLDELKRRARRRLVGAVVLALAAAVFVPMLLESDERPLGDDVSVRIPPVDQGKFVNRLSSSLPGNSKSASSAGATAKAANPKTAPVEAHMSPGSDATIAAANEAKASASKNAAPVAASGGSAATTGAPAQSSSDAEQQGSSAPGNAATHVVAKPDAMPPADAKPARAASSATTKVATSVAISKPTHGGFVVQLAAFSDDKGANALANRLKRGGHPAFTEPVATSRGTLWRVRVGPYASREEADAARDKLKREGQNGIVAARSS